MNPLLVAIYLVFAVAALLTLWRVIKGPSILDRAVGRRTRIALDVFDDEPLPPDSPWWDDPAVLVTPHVSGLAPRYAQQVQQILVENLRRFAAGEPLLNQVDRGRGY